MDSLIAAAARALAVGDVLGALKRVALRHDPPALAIRGIAMAQLGEYGEARELLRRASRGFGPREALARARCVVAEAEVALAMRDLGGSPRTLAAAAATLEARADRANAMQARLIAARRLLLLGRLEQAAAALDRADAHDAPPALAAVAELIAAELALRSLRTAPALAALDRARVAADRASVPALIAEVAGARAALDRPAARRLVGGGEETLRLEQLGDVGRESLIARAFGTRHANASHRARLRVEIGRFRTLVKGLARVDATARGFRLEARGARKVAVLTPPIDGDQASLVALLADGAAWSTSALALALGASQRTVQRALAELESAGRVRAVGRARARRWLSPPIAGFTTALLLPAALPPE